MAECNKTERWQAGQRLMIGQVSMLFINQITTCYYIDGQSGWFGIDKKVCAMVTRINNDTRVLGIGIKGLTMDQLRERITDIDLVLERP